MTSAAPAPDTLRLDDAPGLACRHCGAPLAQSVADLGMHPPCQSIVRPEDRWAPEAVYPLHAFVCPECRLVQIDAVVPPEDIFTEYAYFSSYSTSWLAHASRYAEAMTERFGLGRESTVVEIASNDGYLLRNFVERGIPCLGVEPAANVAKAAEAAGVPTRVAFFGEDEARAMREEGIRADLIAANNVLAHTPHLNSFVAGLAALLTEPTDGQPGGVATLEFPHLVRLMEGNQFDTIYHEHFSYFSFTTAERVFAAHGLTLFDVEELPTHGGSLRIYARHAADTARPVSDAVRSLRQREADWGVDADATYAAFADRVRQTKHALLRFLLEAAAEGKTVAGYGAAGKGNTLLNACGVKPDLVAFTVDRNPYKQDTFLPGSRIPVFAPEAIFEHRPDYVLILPWNLREEISGQMAGIREWGGRFVVPIPELETF
ncbi:MAG TPA: methyltransferase domain-containing protein [Bacteroidetes bacterium]|nr:methyltransferase domain-containing protein [Bacteroidota bacterium]